MSVFALLERLAPHIEREVNLAINSKQEAESLSSKLKKVQVGLQDAERKGATDQNVRNWLQELEDLMFELEDVLDEWEALNLSQQVESNSEDNLVFSSNHWEKVCSVVSKLCSCLLHVFWERREVVLKMKSLSIKLDEIIEEKNKYYFVQGESNGNRFEESISRESTSQLPDKYIGRDLVKESLVRKLVHDEDGGKLCSVISISGVGGVGKTTLAKLAYNDPQVQAHFNLRAWVFVGDHFDPTKVAKDILEALDDDEGASNDSSTLNILVRRINKIVTEKRFLLVLDDVWSEERTKWEELKNCLMAGASGSKILVTTRNEGVARMMGTSVTNLQRLDLLSDADCGTILNEIALEGRSEGEQEKLRDIGMEIAMKCNGLPLAAKNIGSMLFSKFTEQEWLDVLESPLWKYEDEGMNDLFRVLKLSYLELDSTLKRCFLSCILYPKGCEIRLDELIQMWMGYGYISSSSTEDEVQLKALQYFQKLAMRSFFERLEDHDDGVIRFKVHDIMHDFANYMSEKEQMSYLIVEPAYFGAQYHGNFSVDTLQRLRCFSAVSVSMEELPPIFCLLKCVRLLTVLGCDLQDVPQELGKLIHLRYLDLSHNPFRELPQTGTDLCNLQTLDIQGCEELLRLPQGIGKLRKLRHLINKDTWNLTEFPQGLQKLTGLCTLSRFCATGGDDGSKLGWLENLNQLRGHLSIEIEAADEKDATKANLRNKNKLRDLRLYFGESVGQMEVILEALQPPPAIENLVICGHGGKWFPSWLMEPFLYKLKDLYLEGFDDCTLPPLAKLPCLERLMIRDVNIKLLTCEFLGIGQYLFAFPKLKSLSFRDCGSWEEWEDIENGNVEDVQLPCLKHLELVNCSKLKDLPHNLLRRVKSLEKLEILGDCGYLLSLYDQESGTAREKVSHIPNIQAWIED